MTSRAATWGKRAIVVLLGAATVAVASWFVPALSRSNVRPITVEASDTRYGLNEGMAVFRNAAALEASYPGTAGRTVTQVDWDRENLVRIGYRSTGYRLPVEGPEGDVRFGSIAWSERWGGSRVSFFYHEPTPYLIGGPVNQVFAQFFKEQWFAVSKDTHVAWGAEVRFDRDLKLGFAGIGLAAGWAIAFGRRKCSAGADSTEPGTSVV